MYVHHGIHDLIFNFVGTLEASQVGLKHHTEILCDGNMFFTDETICIFSHILWDLAMEIILVLSVIQWT